MHEIGSTRRGVMVPKHRNSYGSRGFDNLDLVPNTRPVEENFLEKRLIAEYHDKWIRQISKLYSKHQLNDGSTAETEPPRATNRAREQKCQET